jgi:hypothetical protein
MIELSPNPFITGFAHPIIYLLSSANRRIITSNVLQDSLYAPFMPSSVSYRTMNSATVKPEKKKYIAPTVNAIGLEEAKIFLRAQTAPDDQHAKDDLLDLLEQTSA